MDTRRSFGERSGLGRASWALPNSLDRRPADWTSPRCTGGGRKAPSRILRACAFYGGGMHFWVSWLFPRRLLLLPARASTGFGSR